MATDFRITVMDTALKSSIDLQQLALYIYDAEQDINVKKLTLAARRATLFSQVAQETVKETGKPKFANDTSREAETASRFADDAIAVTMQVEVQKAERAVRVNRERMNEMQRSIDIRRAFLRGGN